MNILMSWSGGNFDLVGWLKRWLVVASTIVSVEVNFQQETLLNNLKSILKRLPGSRCSMETLG